MTGRDSWRNRSHPQPLGGIMERLVGALGLAHNYYGWLIVSRWPEIVGEHYARNSEAIRFADGVLYVAVPDASWRQMMALDTDKILAHIREFPYGSIVKELRLVWGKKGT